MAQATHLACCAPRAAHATTNLGDAVAGEQRRPTQIARSVSEPRGGCIATIERRPVGGRCLSTYRARLAHHGLCVTSRHLASSLGIVICVC